MIRRIFTAAAALLTLAAAYGQRYGEDRTVVLLENDTLSLPHERYDNGLRGDEREDQPQSITGTVRSQLLVFEADAELNTHRCVILCPGGAYRRLVMDREGWAFARWLNSQGITAAVLKYRLPNGRPQIPVEDVRAAVDYLVANAGELDIDSARIGIVGFSAGGHLAAIAATEPELCERLSFAALFYPVITDDSTLTNEVTMRYLLGERWLDRLPSEYAAERRVTDSTPPTLLLLADDDDVVPPMNGVLFYEALKRAGVPASMHIFPHGGHGWDPRSQTPFCEQWRRILVEWINADR